MIIKMIFEKAINEVKKGCGKYVIGKSYLDENGDKVHNNYTCNEQHLCPTCQKEKDTLQKCSNAINLIINSWFYDEDCDCIYSDYYRLKEQLKEVKLK